MFHIKTSTFWTFVQTTIVAICILGVMVFLSFHLKQKAANSNIDKLWEVYR